MFLFANISQEQLFMKYRETDTIKQETVIDLKTLNSDEKSSSIPYKR